MKIKTRKDITRVRIDLSVEEARELYLMCTHTGGLGVAYGLVDLLEDADIVPDTLEAFLEKHYPEYIDKDPGSLQF